jgi:hypothetical protein
MISDQTSSGHQRAKIKSTLSLTKSFDHDLAPELIIYKRSRQPAERDARRLCRGTSEHSHFSTRQTLGNLQRLRSYPTITAHIDVVDLSGPWIFVFKSAADHEYHSEVNAQF